MVESSFVFKPQMNDVYGEAFNNQSFSKMEMEAQFRK